VVLIEAHLTGRRKMKLYELAEVTGMSVKDLKKELGQKSHFVKLSDEVVAEYLGGEKKIKEARQEEAEVVDTAEAIPEPVVEVPEVVEEKEECPFSLAEIDLGIRCLGGNAPQWKWRHLLNG
jgi:hypothetical protein